MDSFNDIIGEMLLREHVQTAILKDPITQELFSFTRITDVEYQFGRAGDTRTNYVIGCNSCGIPMTGEYHTVETPHDAPQYACSNACADLIATLLMEGPKEPEYMMSSEEFTLRNLDEIKVLLIKLARDEITYSDALAELELHSKGILDNAIEMESTMGEEHVAPTNPFPPASP